MGCGAMFLHGREERSPDCCHDLGSQRSWKACERGVFQRLPNDDHCTFVLKDAPGGDKAWALLVHERLMTVPEGAPGDRVRWASWSKNQQLDWLSCPRVRCPPPSDIPLRVGLRNETVRIEDVSGFMAHAPFSRAGVGTTTVTGMVSLVHML